MLDYSKIPVDYMEGAVRRYIEERINPGHFLSAVICNDLKEAFNRADSNNLKMMFQWVSWFYSEAPADAWGSTEKFKLWLKGDSKE